MGTTIIVGTLCVHLLCFAIMFWLISTRLQGNRLGMDAFALGNAMLGLAYVLQLSGDGPMGGFLSVVNHTLTLCAPLAFWSGALRFFGKPGAMAKPLLATALAYSALQVVVQVLAGEAVRYAMLSFLMAAVFLAMSVAVLAAMRGVASDLRVEMALFAVLIAGLCVLNAIKGALVARGGLPALDMESDFQMVFYIYMSFMATVLAPSLIWLVLRRLTDELRATAARDPLTQLLNRRGLVAGLDVHFRARTAGPARLLLLDIDHFKRINDTHGHRTGDLVLCQVAAVLRDTLRRGDLASRTGGEEFVLVCLDTDDEGAVALAERLRVHIERQTLQVPGLVAPLRCTVTIGVSPAFHSPEGLDLALQAADAALYRGKAAGRNRVEHSAGDVPGFGAPQSE